MNHYNVDTNETLMKCLLKMVCIIMFLLINQYLEIHFIDEISCNDSLKFSLQDLI